MAKVSTLTVPDKRDVVDIGDIVVFIDPDNYSGIVYGMVVGTPTGRQIICLDDGGYWDEVGINGPISIEGLEKSHSIIVLKHIPSDRAMITVGVLKEE